VDTFIITCEHGGNRIPAPYRRLFRGQRALLDSHRGYDPGSPVISKALASAFAAPLVAPTVSRLLIDLNRSIGHPQLFSAVTRAAPAQTRAQIVERYYRPYRMHHISSHSFPAELDGRVRGADVGLLHHPGRRGEAEVCARWKETLAALAPDLRVRRNYPQGRHRRRVNLVLACALRAVRLRRNRTGSQPGHRFRRRPTLDGVAAQADRFVTHGMCGPGRAMIHALRQGAHVRTFSATDIGGHARRHPPDTGEK
jgi:predicted N-formylglutamate amidohydrolase